MQKKQEKQHPDVRKRPPQKSHGCNEPPGEQHHEVMTEAEVLEEEQGRLDTPDVNKQPKGQASRN